MRLFNSGAYGDVTVSEICQAAGVGRATFFRIFNSKAGLLREFHRRLTQRVEARLDGVAPRGAAESLRVVVDEITETWTQAGPGTAEMAVDFIRFSKLADAHAVYPELLDVVVRIMERGMQNGELRDSHFPRLAGALALIQIAAAVAYWLRHPEDSLKDLTDEALATWLHGAIR